MLSFVARNTDHRHASDRISGAIDLNKYLHTVYPFLDSAPPKSGGRCVYCTARLYRPITGAGNIHIVKAGSVDIAAVLENDALRHRMRVAVNPAFSLKLRDASALRQLALAL